MPEKNFDTMKPMTRITYRVRLIDLKEELGYDVPIMSGIAGIDQLTYKEYEEGIMDRSSLPVFKRLSYLTGLSMDYLLGITDIPDAYKPGDGYMDFDISDRVRAVRLNYAMSIKKAATLINMEEVPFRYREVKSYNQSFSPMELVKLARIYDTSVDYLARITDDDKPNMKGRCCTKRLTEEQVEKVKERIIKLCPTPVPRTPIEKKYANRVIELRKENGASREDIARLLGIVPSEYKEMEEAPTLMKAREMKLLADLYNVSLDYLMGRTDIRNYITKKKWRYGQEKNRKPRK